MTDQTSSKATPPWRLSGPINVIDFKDGHGVVDWDDALVKGIITQEQYDNGYGFCWVDLKKS